VVSDVLLRADNLQALSALDVRRPDSVVASLRTIAHAALR
jgi:hypothetical protein